MTTSRLLPLKKQATYLIYFLVFIVLLSPFKSLGEGHHVLLGSLQALAVGCIIWILVTLHKVAHENFSLFINLMTASSVITLVHVVFDIIFPVASVDGVRLTLASLGAFLPHSLFRYMEAITLFAAFVFMWGIASSRQVKKDIIFSSIIILTTIFTVSIELVDLIEESLYGDNFQVFHIAIFFEVIYISLVVLFLFANETKRIIANNRIFKYYLSCLVLLVLWVSVILAVLLLDFFNVDIPILDNSYLLIRGLLLYVVILHVSQEKTIFALDFPHLSRAFIYYFCGIMLVIFTIQFFTKSVSSYVVIGNVIIVIALVVRLIFIKRLDEHATSELQRVAHFDVLTSLPNQKKLFSDIQKRIDYKIPFSVMLININRFKSINRLLSHSVGDELLIKFTEKLQQIVKSTDIYRHGGDEFAVITHLQRESELHAVCARIFESLHDPFIIKKEHVNISVSIGVTRFPDDADNADGIINNLNVALKEAKTLLIDKYKFYSYDMQTDLAEKLVIEKDLQAGLENNEFELYYQPQYSPSRQLVGFEALVRWNHPVKGRVSPVDFIPVAEESALIIPLGEWVLFAACQQLALWLKQHQIPLKMSINVSVRQLQQADFTKRVADIIQSFAIPPSLIMLEITETYPFYTDTEIVGRIKELKDLGCKISIDDFGTGFCSLTSLTKVPIDQIKIAREYISSIGTNSKDEILLTHLFSILGDLSFNVVAEGVETAEQLARATDANCNYIQGYYFSRPLDHLAASEAVRECVAQGGPCP